MVAAPPMLIHPGAVDSCGLRGFSRPDAQPPAVPPPGPLGMKKERRSPRRPFPVKICENSCPPSRRPCPLSLDIPGFSHVLPSCPALSRLSQLSCLFTMAKGAGSNIPGLVMQYDETDWAFIKRMASRFHTVVIPDSQRDHIAYTFGLPEDGVHYAVETNIFSIAKNAGQIIESEDQRMPRADTFFYVLNSREIYRLGDCVTLNGVPLRVYSIKTKMEGSELYHTYYLTSESGFETEEVFNENLIGLSLDAQVTSVERDTVQVLIGCDENQAGCGTRVFPYATVYSTPDGTGWYCMPEIGDAVRLYFPCEKDADAYVASSVHLQSSAGDERINPDFKSIMNKQKKEILFTPGSLLLTNNAGMSIELSDAEGIKIISDKAIVVQSQEAVDISSATSSLSISAPQRIIFQQGNTQMSLEEKLHFGGAQVRID